MGKVSGKRKILIEKTSKVDDVEGDEKNNDEIHNSLSNVINDYDYDSSDSDRDIKDSDNELDQVLYEDGDNFESGSCSSLNEDSENEDDNEISDDHSNDFKNKLNKNPECDFELEQNEEDTDSDDKDDDDEKDVGVKTYTNNKNEYEDYDTSDEEDVRNTVGNIPMNWYDEYKHLGYDWDGNKIIKPATGDYLDAFLQKIEDPDFWHTVKDPQTGQSVVLSEEDIELIKRLKKGKIPDPNVGDSEPWINWFTKEVMDMPLRKFPEHKRSFLPSKHEEKQVSKLVHALKMGWIKTRAEQNALRAKEKPKFYMLWSTDDQPEEMRRIHKHIPAPKRFLPGHAESYNPPSEYLFDEKEMKQWEKQKHTPWKRKLHFVPKKYDSLRKVPAYSRFIKERFLRCLDLYLAPRAIKMKLNIDPESLVPKLPSPKDLQPFPTVLSIEYEGHGDMVRTISCDKMGQYLLSGSDDCTIKVWEVNTGRCLKTIQVDDVVRSVAWCPNASLSLILAATGNKVLLINPDVGDILVCSKTDSVLKEAPQADVVIPETVKSTVQWDEPDENQNKKGVRIIIKHFKEVSKVTWHGRGDYFASVMPEGQNRSVLISQISRRRSQLPFSKPKGLVQSVLFHPTKPFLFVATQRHVRIYDLMNQTLVKKLLTNARWISNMAIHPGGDNLLVATYDRKVLWFDLDLSTKPYQTLRLHRTAVRGVAFHKRYPLFASGSDDRSLIISHGMVYNDLLQNPLIVPLKRLQDHAAKNDFGIFDVMFHPLQPWVFTSGADGTVKLYTN